MKRLGLFRLRLFGLILSLALACPAIAQEQTVEQLKAQYDEALKQLQAAQDRKNELANENELLKKQVESLTQICYASREQMLFLQTHYNLWQMYVAAFPEVGRWFEMSACRSYFFGANIMPEYEMTDLNWPFSAIDEGTAVASE